MRFPDEINKLGSVGRLVEVVEAKIVDLLTGELLSPGQRGELWGTSVFDSDGFLFIVDRLKDMIKYHGSKVPPAELEHLLLSNTAIADAAVVPYALHVHCLQYFSIFKGVEPNKKIQRIAFVDFIPKSAAGKILRRELINRAISNP
ncbi:hypothetical protein Q3G72_015414 [Acer saccharum]|nr:hypothetical protein Q3G72_015414 [Acer saccharum]